MAIDGESKVDTSRPPEPSAPSPDESTTTIDAEPAIPTEVEGDLSKEQQGIRKHLIALSIVLCQLVVALPFGSGLLISYTIPQELGSDPSLGIWIAASYP
ncbi:uncharacterized protein TrAFT101_006227 [Trichoderma asperellum]|uniref:uncharacterized protein n=1 Tax=Trichoderma asperellum TaxID=101201 RepID=UPI00332139C6|nr:hypothetical protein TrAFT101_006227 [Trichoderma asperellum]